MDNREKKGNEALLKICAFIVDKRNLFFLIYAILLIFTLFSKDWVKVENSMSYYLPQSTETKRGLDLMEEEFITYGSCSVMVANLSYNQSDKLYTEIKNMKDVYSVTYDDSDEHYANGSALYNITFNYDENDDNCLVALDLVKEKLNGYDYYLTTTLGNTQSELIAEEMVTISIIVVIIVVSVLLLTSQAYAEVPVLLLTFGSAAAVQMGTNFLLGTISFVSNSVTIVLQLALSVDYAVILLNRYKEEHETMDYREATVVALSKSIPEISGSSLTTIGGLIAMSFMQYGMGPDLAVVLIKAILLSLVSVFCLMPGVIMLFSKAMDASKHKNFIPQIPFVGKFAYFSRFLVAPLFFVVIVISMLIQNNCPYVFGYSTLTTPKLNRVQIAENMQVDTFGDTNMVALMVPAGDYDKERDLLKELEACEEVDHCMGLANIEAMDDYTLTDELSPRQFSELIGIDYEVAELIYAAYAVNDEDYGKVVNGVGSYKVSLIDMFLFVYDEVQDGYVTLDGELQEKLDDAHDQMMFAKNQLQGENYSRMLVYLTLPEESKETLAFLDRMHTIGRKYYDDVIVCGESVSQMDLKNTFARDNTVVNVVSILAVLVVLLFTFKSAGMPVLLIAVIQGSIWINFAVPTLMKSNLFFMSGLIVSSIQMGANIDYAIVIASRYTELRKEKGRRASIIETMNASFPTIITSGTMLASAGVLIGLLTSDGAIVGIGQCLGRGTIISIFITMFVLPQILLVGDTIIEKTSFVMNMPLRQKNASGLVRVDGLVRGQINGTVIGTMHAIVRGDVSAFIEAGEMVEQTEIELQEYKRELEAEKSQKKATESDNKGEMDSAKKTETKEDIAHE